MILINFRSETCQIDNFSNDNIAGEALVNTN